MNVDRLAWALAHSLWQDAAISLVTVILLRMFAKRRAAHRYAVCLVSLLLMVVTPMTTLFFYDWFSGFSRASVSFLAQVIDPSVSIQATLDAGGVWTRWVVAIWLVGVAVSVIRLLTNWRFTRMLIHTASEIVYAQALVKLEQVRAAASLAVAAAGSSLPDRVRRVLGRETASTEWQPAAASSVFVIAVWVIAGMWQVDSLGASPLPPLPPLPASSYLEAAAQEVPTPVAPAVSPTLLQVALATLAGPQQEGRGSVEGTVFRSETNQPLGGAEVTLTKVFAAGSPPPSPAALLQPGAATVTNAQGKFSLRDVPLGSYRLVVNLDGFTPQEYGSRQVGRAGTGTVLNVRAGDALKDIVVRLALTGSVNGRVTNTSGRPQMGLDVALLSPAYDANGGTTFRIAGTAQTDDRGQYRLYWIAPGDYYLTAGPSVFAASSIGVGMRNQKQVTTYYPGVTDRTTAVMIQVKPGMDLNGIDVAVRQTPTYRVRGYVAGLQASNLTLSISPRQPLPSVILMAPQSIRAKADGSFELNDVAPGQYWVRAQLGPARLQLAGLTLSGNPQTDSAGAVAAVDVVSEDVENLVLSTQAAASISGRVTLGGSSLPADLHLSIGLTPAVARDFLTPSIPPSLVNPDGTFTQTKITPGEYQWSVRGLTSTLYIKDARLGAADVLGRSLRLPSIASDSLQIDLSDKAGQIEGVVKDDRQAPVTRAIVALVPDLHRDRRDLYKSVTADASGRFMLVGITPGDYKLFAWEDVAANAFFNADFVRPFEAKGKAVRIGESAKQSLDVTVIRSGSQQ